MKLTIAFLPDDPVESEKARILQEFAGTLLADMGRTGVKVREGMNNPPFKHIYIAAKKPKISVDTARKA